MKQIVISVLIILLVLAGACRKFTEVQPPGELIIAEDVFTSDAKAVSAMTGIYGAMINGEQAFCNYLTTTSTGMLSDELKKINPSATETEFMENQMQMQNTTVRNIWNTCYKYIYFANAVLEGIAGSTHITPPTKTQLRGEGLFVRALCNFYLVNLYGDVPEVTNTNYAENSVKPRQSASEIYSRMITDLEESRQLLTAVYPGGERVRPNKWASTALLARVYLYAGEWAKSEAMASDVLNSGLYTPLPVLQSVFLKTSTEAIWQLQQRTAAPPEPRQLRPASNGRPNYYLSEQLQQGFEPGDMRRQRWVDSVVYLSVKYYFPGKYKHTGSGSNEYYMVLRAGEQYLIRAEARLRQHKVAEALADLNTIRSRAGLAGLSGLSETELRAAIKQERRIEFFSEWGHRWMDVIRNGDADTVFGNIKPNWQSTDKLYPIPYNDIVNNPFLTQNPGY